MFDDVDADFHMNQNVTLPADEDADTDEDDADDNNINQNVMEPLVEPQQPTNVNDSINNMNNVTANNTNNNNDTINNIEHVARGSLKRSRREDYVLVSSTPDETEPWERKFRRRTNDYQPSINNSVTSNSIVRVNNEQVGETTTRDAEEIDDVPNQTKSFTLSQTLLEESMVVSSIWETGKRIYKPQAFTVKTGEKKQSEFFAQSLGVGAHRRARMSRIRKDSKAELLTRKRGITVQVEVVEESAPVEVSNVGDATKVNNEQASVTAPSTPINNEQASVTAPSTPIKKAAPVQSKVEEEVIVEDSEGCLMEPTSFNANSTSAKPVAAPVQAVSTSKVEKVIEDSSKQAPTPSVSSTQKKMNKGKTVKKSSNVSLSKPRHSINKGRNSPRVPSLSRTISLNRSATNVIKPAASSANKTPSNSNNGKQANIPDYLLTNKKPLANARSTRKHSKKASGQTVSFKKLREQNKASASSQGEENVDNNLESKPVTILKKKRVSWAIHKNEISTRPFTLPEDVPSLYYSKSDEDRFAREAAAGIW